MHAAADTAWIDGRDPLYTAVADRWMEQIVADFGSDHVWQMDAFFANGSGWGAEELPVALPATVPPCVWSAGINNTYLAGYVHGKFSRQNSTPAVDAAAAAATSAAAAAAAAPAAP